MFLDYHRKTFSASIILNYISDSSKLHSVVLLIEPALFYELFVLSSLLDSVAVKDNDLVGSEDG